MPTHASQHPWPAVKRLPADRLETHFGELDIEALSGDTISTDLGTNYGTEGRQVVINGVPYSFSAHWTRDESGEWQWRQTSVTGSRMDKSGYIEMTPAAKSKILAALPALIKAWADAHPEHFERADQVRRAEGAYILAKQLDDLETATAKIEANLKACLEGRWYEPYPLEEQPFKLLR